VLREFKVFSSKFRVGRNNLHFKIAEGLKWSGFSKTTERQVFLKHNLVKPPWINVTLVSFDAFSAEAQPFQG
jgi:hypothetical protein